ncbi:MAG TPA: hypothetical protein VHO07_03795 [Streptosporangiaceae bacterium]|nr:hypothetical protein [Streptosporangiaceae bacterium]
MSKLFATRRWIAIVGITAAMVLAGGSAAYAYFTSTGSGTGSASVGSAGSWSVSAGSPSGTIYPGSGSSVITFEITNNGSGDEQYSSASATVNSGSGGAVTVGGVAVTGCLAAWFNATVTTDPHLNEDVQSGNTVQANVKVTMPSDSNDDQDACEGVSPDVTLAIS